MVSWGLETTHLVMLHLLHIYVHVYVYMYMYIHVHVYVHVHVLLRMYDNIIYMYMWCARQAMRIPC